LDSFKAIDLFGQPVSLKFKGKDKFKTISGAIATILMILSLFAYAT